MAGAPARGATAWPPPDTVSPELALVDPALGFRECARVPENREDQPVRPFAAAPEERGRVPDVSDAPLADTVARPPLAARPKPRVFPVPFPDTGGYFEAGAATDALHRLVECSVEPDEPTGRTLSPGQLRRRATLVPTGSAAAATLLLALQLLSSAGTLG
jgi:hypothetical protein